MLEGGILMSNFKVQNGNNMPIQSPLIPDPVVPYACKESETLYAIIEVDESIIRKYLEPTPFEYVNNLAMVYVNDATKGDKIPYMDGGVIIQAKYKDIIGGYYLFEYEDDDAAVATGRELWGYPKKLGHMTLEKNGNVIKGTASRRGIKLIEIECDLSKKLENDFPALKVFPHLNIHTIPKPDGPGIFSQRIIARDNSSDCKLLSEEFGEVIVKLESGETDPLGDLSPVKVLGGGYSVTDFLAGEENGWGKVLDTII